MPMVITYHKVLLVIQELLLISPDFLKVFEVGSIMLIYKSEFKEIFQRGYNAEQACDEKIRQLQQENVRHSEDDGQNVADDTSIAKLLEEKSQLQDSNKEKLAEHLHSPLQDEALLFATKIVEFLKESE